MLGSFVLGAFVRVTLAPYGLGSSLTRVTQLVRADDGGGGGVSGGLRLGRRLADAALAQRV